MKGKVRRANLQAAFSQPRFAHFASVFCNSPWLTTSLPHAISLSMSSQRSQRKARAQRLLSNHSGPATSPRPREPLSENEAQALVDAIRTRNMWTENKTIKSFQMAGIRAQLEGTDTIIQAPTGSGKTLIAAGPHSSPRSKGMITLMSVPLIQLAEDMVCCFILRLSLIFTRQNRL